MLGIILWQYDHRIYEWKTFLAVVAVGVIQDLIAWYSGHLAVVALPNEVTETAKKGHKRMFALLGASLLFLTCVVGYLNDQSQHAAGERADRAEKAEKDNGDKLSQALIGIGQERSNLDTLRNDLAQGKLTPAETISRVEKIQSSLNATIQPAIAPTVLPSVPSPPRSGQPDLKSLSTVDLKKQVDYLAAELKMMDATYTNTDKAIKAQWTTESPKHDAKWMNDNSQTMLEAPITANIMAEANEYKLKYQSRVERLHDEIVSRLSHIEQLDSRDSSSRQPYLEAVQPDSKSTLQHETRVVADDLERLVKKIPD